MQQRFCYVLAQHLDAEQKQEIKAVVAAKGLECKMFSVSHRNTSGFSNRPAIHEFASRADAVILDAHFSLTGNCAIDFSRLENRLLRVDHSRRNWTREIAPFLAKLPRHKTIGRFSMAHFGRPRVFFAQLPGNLNKSAAY